jgi:hypothetical protein
LPQGINWPVCDWMHLGKLVLMVALGATFA